MQQQGMVKKTHKIRTRATQIFNRVARSGPRCSDRDAKTGDGKRNATNAHIHRKQATTLQEKAPDVVPDFEEPDIGKM